MATKARVEAMRELLEEMDDAIRADISTYGELNAAQVRAARWLVEQLERRYFMETREWTSMSKRLMEREAREVQT